MQAQQIVTLLIPEINMTAAGGVFSQWLRNKSRLVSHCRYAQATYCKRVRACDRRFVGLYLVVQQSIIPTTEYLVEIILAY